MFVFLAALRHPEVSNDYSRVEQMFEYCARSVCSQACEDVRFIVVCHRVPDIEFEDSRIEYIEVDWPPASPRAAQQNPHSHKRLDKGRKIALATWHALKYSPSYLFVIDADDWISTRLAGYAESTKSEFGYVVDRGYFVDFASLQYKRRRGLNRYCGSTICPSLELMLAFLPGIENWVSEPTLGMIKGSFSEKFLEEGIGAHKLPDWGREQGMLMESFPFFAASWVLNTGENNRGVAANSSSGGRAISALFCEQHGLPRSIIDQVKTSSHPVNETVGYIKSSIDWFHMKWSGRRRF